MCFLNFALSGGGAAARQSPTWGVPMRGSGRGNSSNVGSISGSSNKMFFVISYLRTYYLQIYLLT